VTITNKNKNPSKYLGNELKYIKKVLNSENWSATTGNWNQALEGAFAKKIGTKYAISMNSGTSTLHAALEAVGVGPGDEVISPALTVIMDSTATIHANAVPVYADRNATFLNEIVRRFRIVSYYRRFEDSALPFQPL
jgi:dTDP-4-amino-4,6-dideoxygalactose transaminase